jgi:hypothetical protein
VLLATSGIQAQEAPPADAEAPPERRAALQVAFDEGQHVLTYTAAMDNNYDINDGVALVVCLARDRRLSAAILPVAAQRGVQTGCAGQHGRWRYAKLHDPPAYLIWTEDLDGCELRDGVSMRIPFTGCDAPPIDWPALGPAPRVSAAICTFLVDPKKGRNGPMRFHTALETIRLDAASREIREREPPASKPDPPDLRKPGAKPLALILADVKRIHTVDARLRKAIKGLEDADNLDGVRLEYWIRPDRRNRLRDCIILARYGPPEIERVESLVTLPEGERRVAADATQDTPFGMRREEVRLLQYGWLQIYLDKGDGYIRGVARE